MHKKLATLKSTLLNENYCFVGTASYEERCIAFFHFLRSIMELDDKKLEKQSYLLEIIDEDSDYKVKAMKLTKEHIKEIDQYVKIDTDKVISYGLEDEELAIEDLQKRLNEKMEEDSLDGINVFLDISTMPRRYILQFLNAIALDEKIKKILLFYTTPLKYNPPLIRGNLLVQELFMGKSVGGKTRIFIASIGLNPTQLKQCIESVEAVDRIYLFAAYPSPIVDDIIYKNSRIIDGWIKERPNIVDRLKYSHPYDPHALINHIKDIIRGYPTPKDSFILAPLGTKVHALGMFVEAINDNIRVLYAQPRTYNPNYSSGIDRYYIYNVFKKRRGDDICLEIDSGILTGRI